MTTIRKSDLSVFDGLSIVKIDGYKPDEPPGYTPDIDLPGSANWLVTEYGFRDLTTDVMTRGILWTDYDCGCDHPWAFTVLIPTDEADEFRKTAESANYDVLSINPITEPCNYGDGGGVCTIMKHPDGWVVVS